MVNFEMKTSDDQQVIDCPACASKTLCRTVTIITEESKELKALFIGELNKATCTSCSVEFVVETPLIYREDRTRFLVYYSPDTSDEQLGTVLAFTDELYQRLFVELAVGEKPECRVTLAPAGFYRKDSHQTARI